MIRPLADWIVIQRSDAEKTTASGIIIPDTAQEKPQRGIVLAVGKGALSSDGKRLKPDVKKGDEVLFAKFGGTEVTLDGKNVIILKESDIFGVFPKKSKS